MQHAEAGTNWTLSTSDAASVKSSDLYQNTLYGQVQSDVSTWATSNPSGGSYTDPLGRQVFSSSDPDLYFAFHSLNFSVKGTVDTDSSGAWIYPGTVSLSKNWSFANYGSGGIANSGDAIWNAVGYRLQYYGWISAYSVSGAFSDTWIE